MDPLLQSEHCVSLHLHVNLFDFMPLNGRKMALNGLKRNKYENVVYLSALNAALHHLTAAEELNKYVFRAATDGDPLTPRKSHRRAQKNKRQRVHCRGPSFLSNGDSMGRLP